MKQINGQTIETELIITFSLPRIRMKHDDREKKRPWQLLLNEATK